MSDFKRIIIANWKMKLGFDESVELVEEMEEQFRDFRDREVVLCPDFLSLPAAKVRLTESGLKLGAQDSFWEEQGSYTGEISPLNLKEIGCNYVIVGHSERRKNLMEDYHIINKKVKAALNNKLTPIMCIGEKLEEKEEGKREEVLEEQLRQGLKGVELHDKYLIVAYEPIWAIGSGKTITDEDIEEVYGLLDSVLKDIFPDNHEGIFTIYGGSVNSQNVSGFKKEQIDGLLVGGASLQAEEFLKISQQMLKNDE